MMDWIIMAAIIPVEFSPINPINVKRRTPLNVNSHAI
jgi:hypothetical protein